MKTVPSLKPGFFLWALLFQLCIQCAAFSQTVLNYQGRVISGGTAFNGIGQFKFAIVSADGSTVYWKNDGTTTADSPATAVSLPVNKGLFSVQLGDASILNMGTIGSSVLSNNGLKLRVWFNDGVKNWQQFSPDQGIVLASNNTNGTGTGSVDLIAKAFAQTAGIRLATISGSLNSSNGNFGSIYSGYDTQSFWNQPEVSLPVAPAKRVSAVKINLNQGPFGSLNLPRFKGYVNFVYKNGQSAQIDWSRDAYGSYVPPGGIPPEIILNPLLNSEVSAIYAQILVFNDDRWRFRQCYIDVYTLETSSISFSTSTVARKIFVTPECDSTAIINGFADLTDSSGVVISGALNSWINLGELKVINQIKLRGEILQPNSLALPGLRILIDQ